MKRIVLSRRGFDSSSGGTPSLIFPDGRFLSLPIPAPLYYRPSPKQFRDVLWDGRSIAPLVECLSGIGKESLCHLDPDIKAEAIPRQPEWRPALGQSDGEQTHLADHGVGPGDLFLFFGWLQVHDVLSLRTDADYDRALRKYPWLSEHPHLDGSFKEPHRRLRKRPINTVYVSTPRLDIPGLDLPGGGVFQNYDHCLVLSDPEEVERGASCRRSYWRLPEWFWPAYGCSLMSRKLTLRRRNSPWIHVDSGGRGQEFVIDMDGIRDTANEWLHSLFDT